MISGGKSSLERLTRKIHPNLHAKRDSISKHLLFNTLSFVADSASLHCTYDPVFVHKHASRKIPSRKICKACKVQTLNVAHSQSAMGSLLYISCQPACYPQHWPTLSGYGIERLFENLYKSFIVNGEKIDEGISLFSEYEYGQK